MRFAIPFLALIFFVPRGFSEEPAPVKIPRANGPPTIPDVAADEVIGFTLYTVNKGVLKLTAQLYPLKEGAKREVTLFTSRKGGRFIETAKAKVNPEGWMATFRVEGWDAAQEAKYVVKHAGGSSYEGLVRRDPVGKNEIVVASLSCNSNADRGPREDVVRNLKAQDPDLLFFAGDQVYDHVNHTAAWLNFGKQFGELMRDRPTITIPDDHDVGQPNLWGEGGKKSLRKDGADGGYTKSADYVKMVQRAQTSHLPDPYDPTPIKQGIGTYYTSMTLGGISFAIIEDRKFKTGPYGLVPEQGPRPDHINDPDYDRSTVDLPEARLLGERQLKFLREWSQDWKGAEMKAVLSQTPFAGGAHLHGKSAKRLLADLDSNGWPQAGRKRALHEIRRGFAIHLAGDQHLATVIHQGTQAWEDCGISFCSPGVMNFYPRWWWPEEAATPGGDVVSSDLEFTGRHYDGFGNKLTMHAYANPIAGNQNGAGYALVRFRKAERTMVRECWGRDVDVTAPDAKQFDGWPLTFTQAQQYGREARWYLPELLITGREDAVVQVIDEALGEPVYTIRINGNAFRPGVFREATYTIRIGEGRKIKEFTGIQSVGEIDDQVIDVKL